MLQAMVDDDFHRYAAHDLYKITGRILGGKCGEAGAAASLNALDMTAQVKLGVGIHLDVDTLSHPHAIELGLLEVGDDPDVPRHQVEDLLAGLGKGALINIAASDLPILGGRHFGVRQIELRLSEIRPRLLYLRLALQKCR